MTIQLYGEPQPRALLHVARRLHVRQTGARVAREPNPRGDPEIVSLDRRQPEAGFCQGRTEIGEGLVAVQKRNVDDASLAVEHGIEAGLPR